MRKRKFINLLNTRVRESTFEYIVGKQKSKDIQMAEYLTPGANISISQNRRCLLLKIEWLIFQRIGKIQTESCVCGQRESMIHLYKYEILSGGKQIDGEY